MGLFDWFRPKMSEKQLSQLQSSFMQAAQRYINGIAIYPDYKTYSNAERYCTTDDVYSIINLLSTTAALIPFYGYQKGKDGQLEKLPDEHELNLLMQAPIYGYSQFEGLLMCYITFWYSGRCFMLKEVPEFGVNKGKVKALHYVHPQNINVVVTAEHPKRIMYYQYVENGKVIRDEIPPEEVIHIKNFNPQIGISGQEFVGLSNLDVLTKRLSRIDSNMDATTAQMQNGGVKDFIWDKVIPDEQTASALGLRKKAFYDFLKDTTNAGAPYFAAGEMGGYKLGSSLVDLDAANLATIDFKKLCNAYMVSDRLFNNDATGSEISDKNAGIRLYTVAVLPVVRRFRDAFNKAIAPDGKAMLMEDITNIPELQDDMKQMADIFATLPIMIPNNILEAFKYPRSTDPNMDLVYVKTGYSLLEDLQMPEPVDNTGDYGNQNI